MNDLFDEVEVTDNQIRKLPFALPKVEECSVQWDEALQGFVIRIPNGKLFYAPQFFSKKSATVQLNTFWKMILMMLQK
ncbi:hypothetical protein MY149_10835 [Acinetobacter indicus]|nr:hypothetical protein [Acinetobacter indicus]